MKRFSSFLWAGAAGVFLSACAYTPLYAPKHQAHVMVGAVTVSNPDILPGERRTAQDVSRELKQRFPSLDPNGYSLRVSLFEDLGTLAVQRSATVARAEVVLTATFTLTDAAGTDVLIADVVSRAAYNVEETPFSTESGRRYARLTAARNVAQEVALRVSQYLKNHPETP